MSSSLRPLALGLSLAGALATGGCGLHVTNSVQPPVGDDAAVAATATALAELEAFNDAVGAVAPYDITTVLQPAAVQPVAAGHVFVANLGDGVLHLSVWEHLTPTQHNQLAELFAGGNLGLARQRYELLFYRFLTVGLGAKQLWYEVRGVLWVYATRSLFNFERDSIRMAVAYYDKHDRSVLPRVAHACWQLNQTNPHPFNKVYFFEHVYELADPTWPIGYLHYVCAWFDFGLETKVSLAEEIQWMAVR